MDIKVVYKNKKYDDSIFRSISEDDSKEIMDWWLYEDDVPVFISEPLQFKFIRDDIFNIEAKKSIKPRSWKFNNGVIN